MVVDRFTEFAAERFSHTGTKLLGKCVMWFIYDTEVSAPDSDDLVTRVGLWPSSSLVKKSIEMAHYIPDLECSSALRKSGSFVRGSSAVWLGIGLSLGNFAGVPKPVVELPDFLLEDYSPHFSENPSTSFQTELEARFGVVIDAV
jgi:hypothetical protein